MLCWLIQHGLYQEHTQTEKERNIVLYPSVVEIGDFSCRIKAKNAFYYSPTISPARLYKYTFFVQYYALIKSIISFKYKDFSSFLDGNNRILCPSKLVGHYISDYRINGCL